MPFAGLGGLGGLGSKFGGLKALAGGPLGIGLAGLGAGSLLGGGAFAPGGTTSRLETRQFPGVFGAGPEARRLATGLEGILTQAPSDIFGTLQQELLQPQFGPTTASETAMLESLRGLTGGATAARGLGVPTEGALAQAIAPTLAGMRTQRISNLIAALSPELQRRGQDISGLMQLAGMAMPQIIAGQRQVTRGPGLGRELLTGAVSGAAKGLFGG